MPGLYLHIPFCRRACTYCDFHFSTSLGTKDRVLKAMARELEERAPGFDHGPLTSIYFGGGTPSLLEPRELEALLDRVRRPFTVDPEAEVT
ncbi:MAG: radical SAM protein, partial [Flavobacteriales bacterium]|nr:radical SAM protein [Flavobacteriales bacterium]